MKTKFLEKAYLLTLLLFLVFLNVSIFILCIFTFNSNMKATENSCVAESNVIVGAFENDAKRLSSGSIYPMQISYGSFYSGKNIYLRFEENGKETFSNLPLGLEIPGEGYMQADKADGKNYILITSVTTDGRYTVTYAKDVSYLYSEFTTLAISFISLSAAASVGLAVILYLILLKLYFPISRLRKVAEKISNGDFSARAVESGDDEFSALAKDFNSMADTVSSQMAELTTVAEQRQRMLDDLAHEMRTPLTVIHGYAEYIAGANIPKKEQTDALKTIMQEAMRLKSISEILLDSAYIREGKIELAKINVRNMLDDLCRRYSLKSREKGVKIEVKCCEDICIEGDKVLLELLVSNLTDNAINACKTGGSVDIGVLTEGEDACLYVKDDGVGMTEEQLKHIKEPFYRVDKARSRRNGGTGLGLALCDTVARAHGTSLEFSSREGEGTLAYIKLKKTYKSITN